MSFFGFDFSINPTYDLETGKYKEFKDWVDAVRFAQSNKMKNWTIIKVEDHYEIH